MRQRREGGAQGGGEEENCKTTIKMLGSGKSGGEGLGEKPSGDRRFADANEDISLLLSVSCPASVPPTVPLPGG